MKILVLGAGGKTGQFVVEKAVEAGHIVTAMLHSARDDDKHPFSPLVKVIHGDVRNPSRLRAAMEGCEAVIDAIGGTKPFMDTDLESSSAKVVLGVMKETGTKRLIAVSAMGVGESKEQADFWYEHLLMPVFLRGIMKDKAAMEDTLHHSDVEWVIVRPPLLKDDDETGVVKIVPEGEKAHQITRGDLAHFLVEQLTSDAHLRQAVTIANS